jgi:hypothetical protein
MRRRDSLPAPNERRILGLEKPIPSTPRLALSRKEAAKAMGISVDSFERHVQPHLRCTYLGAKRIYSIDDIRAWLDRNAVSP